VKFRKIRSVVPSVPCEQSISLHVGASSYRTYSTKTLGRPGAWAVEARDDAGRVLARAEFTCAP